jgi:hypothetical protein
MTADWEDERVSEAVDPVGQRLDEMRERLRNDADLHDRVRRWHEALSAGRLPNGQRRPLPELQKIVEGIF